MHKVGSVIVGFMVIQNFKHYILVVTSTHTVACIHTVLYLQQLAVLQLAYLQWLVVSAAHRGFCMRVLYYYSA